MYTGWAIDEKSVNALKQKFAPAHPDFLGHHITYQFGNSATVPAAAEIKVIGHCLTDKVQCLVVEVNGSVVRPDGAIYHLTWSIDRSKGAKPVDSNKAIMEYGFEHLDKPISLSTSPKEFTN